MKEEDMGRKTGCWCFARSKGTEIDGEGKPEQGYILRHMLPHCNWRVMNCINDEKGAGYMAMGGL